MTSLLSALILQQENNYICMSECQHLSVHLLASLLEPSNTTNASEPLHLFLNLIFAPLTLSPGYFSVSSYWSLNLLTYSQQNIGKHYKQTMMMDTMYQPTNTIK